ncbi:M20/M25/M40 family metallo-hydrolase [Fervidibacillus halotolerans]|uniref:M20/M25/M40 family metallo-hydrolase n=1 Tax=Fervidibacillus halotolerans TaxID=2980027 RepID=A0A9E8S1B8_9BACI|nr:M20/M25/M40 family metallo-hydrolase [Fervidibacillus halotolerans]WAA13367.1 M20/M25/M40 family metallo-hydrolase [Fervidibacillus halotolerans]
MKTWNQLFVRHGWLVKEVERNVFDCSGERKENITFLQKSLQKVGANFSLEGMRLYIQSEPVHEKEWIRVLDFEHRGRTERLFDFENEEMIINEIDTYIAGVVRQLNRLGFYTRMSCDGHERRMPSIHFLRTDQMVEIVMLFQWLGVSELWNRSEFNRNNRLSLPVNRSFLLELAERLSFLEKDWIEKGKTFIEEKIFQQKLEQLLSIPGESGNETDIRSFVVEQLTPFVDHIAIDHYGNILAEKTGRRIGPVILLNAHLDTREPIVEGRKIIKKGNIWSSDAGILGADDRAGVAILLQIAEQLHRQMNIGTVKFAFTVEEEIGLVGAKHVEDYFLWNVDAAIVVDRRGTGDIVTSFGESIPYCNPLYGQFFEMVAQQAGQSGWKCTPGGSSDTHIWASHGIESVNLSVGYGNEHTDMEILDVKACFRTYQLVKEAILQPELLRMVLRTIRQQIRRDQTRGRNNSLYLMS